MTEAKYANTFTQFLNDYRGAFQEVLEAQSVNLHHLAPSLFDALAAAPCRFATLDGFGRSAIDALGVLWDVMGERRRPESAGAARRSSSPTLDMARRAFARFDCRRRGK
jgi:hypothetical protein